MVTAGGKTLYNATDLERMIARLAHQIIEQNSLGESSTSKVLLLGLPTRGIILADRLAKKIHSFTNSTVETGVLDITSHRDDLPSSGKYTSKTSIPGNTVTDLIVILVDDVLFSGRTIRAALAAINQYGRPQKIQLAVLVDRGHRELPIRADYVGKNIPTSLQEIIQVHFQEVDNVDQILLRKPA